MWYSAVIMNDYLVERALELLTNEELLVNARKGAPVCITAAGYLLSLESGASRWTAERFQSLTRDSNHSNYSRQLTPPPTLSFNPSRGIAIIQTPVTMRRTGTPSTVSIPHAG